MSPARRRARDLRLLAALALAAALLAGCSAATPTSPTSTTSTSTSTTTTTTTLPNVIGVNGTQPSGAAAFLGPISRIAVVSLAPGVIEPPAGSLSPVGVATLPRLAFRSIGSGPDLLLIPGEHATISSFDPSFIHALEADYTVTEIDPPDVGFSDEVGHLSIDSEADLVAGLIVELKLTDPVVAGWGLGASVALAVAQRHRDLVDGLVALDPIGATRPSADCGATLASVTATAAQLADCYFPSDGAKARATYLADESETIPDEIIAPAIRIEAELVAQLEAHPPSPASLASLGVPTLVIGAQEDEVAPVANATALAAAITGAHLEVLSDGGYAAIFAQTATVLADLQAFTSSLPTPTMPSGPSGSTGTSGSTGATGTGAGA